MAHRVAPSISPRRSGGPSAQSLQVAAAFMHCADMSPWSQRSASSRASDPAGEHPVSATVRATATPVAAGILIVIHTSCAVSSALCTVCHPGGACGRFIRNLAPSFGDIRPCSTTRHRITAPRLRLRAPVTTWPLPQGEANRRARTPSGPPAAPPPPLCADSRAPVAAQKRRRRAVHGRRPTPLVPRRRTRAAAPASTESVGMDVTSQQLCVSRLVWRAIRFTRHPFRVSSNSAKVAVAAPRRRRVPSEALTSIRVPVRSAAVRPMPSRTASASLLARRRSSTQRMRTR